MANIEEKKSVPERIDNTKDWKFNDKEISDYIFDKQNQQQNISDLCDYLEREIDSRDTQENYLKQQLTSDMRSFFVDSVEAKKMFWEIKNKIKENKDLTNDEKAIIYLELIFNGYSVYSMSQRREIDFRFEMKIAKNIFNPNDPIQKICDWQFLRYIQYKYNNSKYNPGTVFEAGSYTSLIEKDREALKAGEEAAKNRKQEKIKIELEEKNWLTKKGWEWFKLNNEQSRRNFKLSNWTKYVSIARAYWFTGNENEILKSDVIYSKLTEKIFGKEEKERYEKQRRIEEQEKEKIKEVPNKWIEDIQRAISQKYFDLWKKWGGVFCAASQDRMKEAWLYGLKLIDDEIDNKLNELKPLIIWTSFENTYNTIYTEKRARKEKIKDNIENKYKEICKDVFHWDNYTNEFNTMWQWINEYEDYLLSKINNLIGQLNETKSVRELESEQNKKYISFNEIEWTYSIDDINEQNPNEILKSMLKEWEVWRIDYSECMNTNIVTELMNSWVEVGHENYIEVKSIENWNGKQELKCVFIGTDIEVKVDVWAKLIPPSKISADREKKLQEEREELRKYEKWKENIDQLYRNFPKELKEKFKNDENKIYNFVENTEKYLTDKLINAKNKKYNIWKPPMEWGKIYFVDSGWNIITEKIPDNLQKGGTEWYMTQRIIDKRTNLSIFDKHDNAIEDKWWPYLDSNQKQNILQWLLYLSEWTNWHWKSILTLQLNDAINDVKTKRISKAWIEEFINNLAFEIGYYFYNNLKVKLSYDFNNKEIKGYLNDIFRWSKEKQQAWLRTLWERVWYLVWADINTSYIANEVIENWHNIRFESEPYNKYLDKINELFYIDTEHASWEEIEAKKKKIDELYKNAKSWEIHENIHRPSKYSFVTYLVYDLKILPEITSGRNTSHFSKEMLDIARNIQENLINREKIAENGLITKDNFRKQLKKEISQLENDKDLDEEKKKRLATINQQINLDDYYFNSLYVQTKDNEKEALRYWWIDDMVRWIMLPDVSRLAWGIKWVDNADIFNDVNGAWGWFLNRKDVNSRAAWDFAVEIVKEAVLCYLSAVTAWAATELLIANTTRLISSTRRWIKILKRIWKMGKFWSWLIRIWWAALSIWIEWSLFYVNNTILSWLANWQYFDSTKELLKDPRGYAESIAFFGVLKWLWFLNPIQKMKQEALESMMKQPVTKDALIKVSKLAFDAAWLWVELWSLHITSNIVNLLFWREREPITRESAIHQLWVIIWLRLAWKTGLQEKIAEAFWKTVKYKIEINWKITEIDVPFIKWMKVKNWYFDWYIEGIKPKGKSQYSLKKESEKRQWYIDEQAKDFFEKEYPGKDYENLPKEKKAEYERRARKYLDDIEIIAREIYAEENAWWLKYEDLSREVKDKFEARAEEKMRLRDELIEKNAQELFKKEHPGEEYDELKAEDKNEYIRRSKEHLNEVQKEAKRIFEEENKWWKFDELEATERAKYESRAEEKIRLRDELIREKAVSEKHDFNEKIETAMKWLEEIKSKVSEADAKRIDEIKAELEEAQRWWEESINDAREKLKWNSDKATFENAFRELMEAYNKESKDINWKLKQIKKALKKTLWEKWYEEPYKKLTKNINELYNFKFKQCCEEFNEWMKNFKKEYEKLINVEPGKKNYDEIYDIEEFITKQTELLLENSPNMLDKLIDFKWAKKGIKWDYWRELHDSLNSILEKFKNGIISENEIVREIAKLSTEKWFPEEVAKKLWFEEWTQWNAETLEQAINRVEYYITEYYETVGQVFDPVIQEIIWQDAIRSTIETWDYLVKKWDGIWQREYSKLTKEQKIERMKAEDKMRRDAIEKNDIAGELSKYIEMVNKNPSTESNGNGTKENLGEEAIRQIQMELSRLETKLSNMNFSATEVYDICKACTDAMIFQTIESQARTMGDHWINHIEWNIIRFDWYVDSRVWAWRSLWEWIDISKGKLMWHIISIIHDSWYAAYVSRWSWHFDWSSFHPTTSQKYFDEIISPLLKWKFSQKEIDLMSRTIWSHDWTTLDWNNPITTFTHMADNMAIWVDKFNLMLTTKQISEYVSILATWGWELEAWKEYIIKLINENTEIRDGKKQQLISAVNEFDPHSLANLWFFSIEWANWLIIGENWIPTLKYREAQFKWIRWLEVEAQMRWIDLNQKFKLKDGNTLSFEEALNKARKSDWSIKPLLEILSRPEFEKFWDQITKPRWDYWERYNVRATLNGKGIPIQKINGKVDTNRIKAYLLSWYSIEFVSKDWTVWLRVEFDRASGELTDLKTNAYWVSEVVRRNVEVHKLYFNAEIELNIWTIGKKAGKVNKDIKIYEEYLNTGKMPEDVTLTPEWLIEQLNMDILDLQRSTLALPEERKHISEKLKPIKWEITLNDIAELKTTLDNLFITVIDVARSWL